MTTVQKAKGEKMLVVDKKPVPIYEVECYECHSKIEYKACEVAWCHITCPVCGVSIEAYAISPKRYESERKEDGTIR